MNDPYWVYRGQVTAADLLAAGYCADGVGKAVLRHRDLAVPTADHLDRSEIVRAANADGLGGDGGYGDDTGYGYGDYGDGYGHGYGYGSGYGDGSGDGCGYGDGNDSGDGCGYGDGGYGDGYDGNSYSYGYGEEEEED